MSNYLRREHDKQMATDPEYRKNTHKDDLVAYTAMAGVTGLAIAAGVMGNGNKTPVHKVGPDGPMIEQFGGHPSKPTNSVEPGTGTLHTQSGDFHVTQK